MRHDAHAFIIIRRAAARRAARGCPAAGAPPSGGGGRDAGARAAAWGRRRLAAGRGRLGVRFGARGAAPRAARIAQWLGAGARCGRGGPRRGAARVEARRRAYGFAPTSGGRGGAGSSAGQGAAGRAAAGESAGAPGRGAAARGGSERRGAPGGGPLGPRVMWAGGPQYRLIARVGGAPAGTRQGGCPRLACAAAAAGLRASGGRGGRALRRFRAGPALVAAVFHPGCGGRGRVGQG